MEFINWLSSNELVARFQALCGVEPLTSGSSYYPSGGGKKTDATSSLLDEVTHKEEKPLLMKNFDRVGSRAFYWLFKFGSLLGQEEFYATFFPFAFWNLDRTAGRKMILIWALSMYIGQSLKDILRRPRPRSPPVVPLEQIYLSEYGMPSTHAIVGFSIPFSFFMFCLDRYLFWSGFAIAAAWCCLVCLSRVYMGMHSFWDVLCGLSLSICLLFLFAPFAHWLNVLLYSSVFVPITIAVASFVLCCLYPAENQSWTPTWADTTAILAVFAGVNVGCYAYFWFGYAQRLLGPAVIGWPDMMEWAKICIRTVLGVTLVLLVRSVCKLIGWRVAATFYGVSETELNNMQPVKVALVVKFVTYFFIAVNACFTIPVLHVWLGIASEMKTDM